MQLEILGMRGEVESKLPGYEYNSGVLLDGKLLLDFGEMSFLNREPKWILITHLHEDHACFLKHPLTRKDVEIYAPENSNIIHLQIKSEPFSLGGYHITPIPTQHSLKVRSQGYRIDDGSSSILYTGDLLSVDPQYRPLFTHLDLVITDGSFIRKGGMVRYDPDTGKPFGHAGIPDLIKLFAPYTKGIVFTHFGEWFFEDPEAGRNQIINLGKELGVSAVSGKEGMVVSL